MELLHTALGVAQSRGPRMFELRAAFALAAHDPRRAREVVAAALASLPESEPWPDIVRASGLLALDEKPQSRQRAGARSRFMAGSVKFEDAS